MNTHTVVINARTIVYSGTFYGTYEKTDENMQSAEAYTIVTDSDPNFKPNPTLTWRHTPSFSPWLPSSGFLILRAILPHGKV